MIEKNIKIDDDFIQKIRNYQKVSPLHRLNILEKYRRFITEALTPEKKNIMDKLRNMTSWNDGNI